MMRHVLGSGRSIGGVLGSGRGAATADWWLSGGVSAANAIAVYQPIGAASLAASYTNLANPGIFNAAPGVAPTWAAATGWTFNGSAQYLTTGVVPSGTWSMIVRIANMPAETRDVCGATGANQAFFIRVAAPQVLGYNNTVAIGGVGISGAPGNDVLTIAGTKFYRNGTAAASNMPGTAQATNAARIGLVSNYAAGDILAFAIYDTTLSAAQVAAISTAMAALTG